MWRLAIGRLTPWLIGAAASIAIGFGGWLWHEWKMGGLERDLAIAEAENVRLRDNVKQWMAHAEWLQAEMERAEADRRRAKLAVQHLLLRLDEVRQDTQPLITEIEAAPPSEDGPVAPVLADALQGLAQ